MFFQQEEINQHIALCFGLPCLIAVALTGMLHTASLQVLMEIPLGDVFYNCLETPCSSITDWAECSDLTCECESFFRLCLIECILAEIDLWFLVLSVQRRDHFLPWLFVQKTGMISMLAFKTFVSTPSQGWKTVLWWYYASHKWSLEPIWDVSHCCWNCLWLLI